MTRFGIISALCLVLGCGGDSTGGDTAHDAMSVDTPEVTTPGDAEEDGEGEADVAPSPSDVTQGAGDTTAATDTTPGTADTPPSPEDTTLGPEDTTPGVEDTTSGVEDTTPGVDDTTSGGDISVGEDSHEDTGGEDTASPSDSASSGCTPGSTQACLCDDEAEGIETCDDEPLVIHILAPFSTQSPPSSRAVVINPPGFDPKSGSVSPKQPMISPLAIFGSHAFRCASLPNA